MSARTFAKRTMQRELDDFAEGVHCEELNFCEWKQLLLCLDEERENRGTLLF